MKMNVDLTRLYAEDDQKKDVADLEIIEPKPNIVEEG